METYSKSIFLREQESSVAEVIQTFTKSFQLDHPEENIALGRVEVTDSSGNTFQPSDDLYALLNNKDDCFVVTKKKAKKATAAPPLPTPSSTAAPSTASVSTGKSEGSSSTATSPTASSAGKPLNYDQAMTSVEELVSQKSLRKARDICQTIVSTAAHRDDIRALEHLCNIAFECRKYSSAVELGEKALRGFVDARARLHKAADNTPLLLSLLHILQTMARSHAEVDDSEEALERAAQGLHLLASCCRMSPSTPCAAKLIQLPATILQGSYSDSMTVRSEVLAAPTIVPLAPPQGAPPHIMMRHKALSTLELDFKADMTLYLFSVGRNEEAGAVVNALVSHPSSANHMLSLLVYAEIAAAYNKIPEAVQGALKAVVLDSTHKRAKALIAKLLSSDAGLHEVYKQVPPTPQAAAAYSFLASVAKDLSCLDAAETLLRQVVKQDPRKDATHFLGLVHVLEGKLDLKSALNTITLAIATQLRRAEYEECQATSEFFPGTSVRRWCQEWNDLLKEAVASVAGGQRGKASPLVDVTTDTQGLFVTFVRKSKSGSSGAVLLQSGRATSGTQQCDGDFALVRPLPRLGEPEDLEQQRADEQALALEESGLDKAAQEYGNNELDILALSFTAVKLLFLLGQLGALPRLIRHLEWARRASKKPLHETNIRNEHAYYLCIVQILGYYSCPTPDEGLDGVDNREQFSPLSPANREVISALVGGSRGASALYVVGDSHILSSAFAVLRPAGSDPRVLVPRLVTGVKQWHLRRESTFYPKEIFRRTMTSVPDGSEVMFLIGEIDCREGILVAVERGVYANVEEGMRATLSVFKQVVQDLIRKKRLRVYIHPIIPVLDVTRQIVQMFNGLYRDAMRGIQGCTWLDMESEFVEASPPSRERVPGDGACSLRTELQLDGTHVSPRYVSLLQASLERCLASKKS